MLNTHTWDLVSSKSWNSLTGLWDDEQAGVESLASARNINTSTSLQHFERTSSAAEPLFSAAWYGNIFETHNGPWKRNHSTHYHFLKRIYGWKEIWRVLSFFLPPRLFILNGSSFYFTSLIGLGYKDIIMSTSFGNLRGSGYVVETFLGKGHVYD